MNPQPSYPIDLLYGFCISWRKAGHFVLTTRQFSRFVSIIRWSGYVSPTRSVQLVSEMRLLFDRARVADQAAVLSGSELAAVQRKWRGLKCISPSDLGPTFQFHWQLTYSSVPATGLDQWFRAATYGVSNFLGLILGRQNSWLCIASSQNQGGALIQAVTKPYFHLTNIQLFHCQSFIRTNYSRQAVQRD